ncbi:hypothetical protein VTI74DRAFT_10888 [Chaetomium olivicolor]
MTQRLEIIFGELGITQYLDAFLEQGFDTWETILDITESDLDALGVKLGHRRKLQRRIANSRGIAPDVSLVSPTQSNAEEAKGQDAAKPESPRLEAREAVGAIVTKRKYRRHPKPDENAPERPPSAYVLFSNKMREELKGRNLSFTEIAKLVGENWQNLTQAEKEPFESQAQAIKDKYLSDLAEYKKTPEYRKYMAYLQEFKAKHASPSQDKDASKRLRLSESQGQVRGSPNATPTRTSRSGSGAESRRGSEPPTGRQRVGSIASMNESQYTASVAPSVSIASPEEPVLSPSVSISERHSSELSPTLNPDHRDQPPLPGPRQPNQGEEQSREQRSMHRHLPSLSDVFDGQDLPGGVRPSHETNGFRFQGSQVPNQRPPMCHPNSDAHPTSLTNGQPYHGHPPPNPAFSHPRPPVDGPLPIHALLASKPEPTFQPKHAPQSPPQPHHGNPYQKTPRFVHHVPNGSAGLPIINGYHHNGPPLSHHQPPMAGQHPNSGYSTPPQLTQPQPPATLSSQGKQNANLDGMSALLKAGEIVDRRAQ